MKTFFALALTFLSLHSLATVIELRAGQSIIIGDNQVSCQGNLTPERYEVSQNPRLVCLNRSYSTG